MLLISIKRWLSVSRFSLVSLICFSGYLAYAQTSSLQADFTVPSKICQEDLTFFEDQSTKASGDTLTYQWYFEGAEVEHAIYNWAKWDDVGNKVVSLTIYNQHGDSSVKSINITVLDAPKADFELTELCCEDQLIITNKSTAAISGLTYEIFSPGLDTNMKFKCSGSDVQKPVTLRAYLPNGCVDSLIRSTVG